VLKFATNKSVLHDTDLIVVNKLASQLKEFEDVSIKLIGHTDADGSDEFNYKLALNRALETKSLLVAKGINSNRILVISKGEKEPLKPNQT